MKTYRISQTDLEVSRIAFGCDNLVEEGISPDALRADDIAHASRIIHTADESGITLFDTAEIYGGGSSEAALGEVFAQSPGFRDRVVIQTKCIMGQSRAAIGSSVEGSLKRLGTDYLDILLLHVQDPLVEPEEVAQAFDELKDSGKVRYFGVCNHTIPRFALLKAFVRQPLVVHQMPISLANTDLLGEAYFNGAGFQLAGAYTGIAGLDYCRLNDIHVQAYSPLRGKDVFGKAALLGPPTDAQPEIRKAATALHEMAAEKNLTPAALALAWLLRHPGRILPVIGTKRAEHIVDCCAADEIELSREEWGALWWAAVNPS
jgi:predicted oxidoreductase